MTDDPKETAKSIQTLKNSLVLALMAPVLVALIVGAYMSWGGSFEGYIILGSGVGLGVLNGFVLNWVFARLDAPEPRQEELND